MSIEELKSLFKKYFEGNASEQEKEIIAQLLANNPSAEIVHLFDSYYLLYADPIDYHQDQKERVWKSIEGKIVRKNREFLLKSKWLKYAGIFLIIGFSAFLLSRMLDHSNQFIEKNTESNNIVINASNYPLIEGLITNQGPISITKEDYSHYGFTYTDDEILILNDQFITSNIQIKISTRKGETQQIITPDGTKIWLNSHSEIVIPSTFNITQRELNLQGEAYFEVYTNDQKPFIVYSIDQKTEVIGTHFNIRAYSHTKTQTTLLEGRVKVYKGNQSIILNPGEQSFSDDVLTKKTVDTENVVAWANGYFYFDNSSMRYILEQIKDWYSIDTIVYETTS